MPNSNQAHYKDNRFDQAVLTKQTELICEQFRTLPLFGLAGVLLLVSILWSHADTQWLLSWVGFGLFVYLLWTPFTLVSIRRASPEHRYGIKARKLAMGLAILEGLSWGSTAILLFSVDTSFHQMALLTIVVGVASITAISNTAYRPTFHAQLFTILIPYVVVFFFLPENEYRYISPGLLVYLLILLSFNKYIYNFMLDALYLQLAYKEQKDLAEKAHKNQTQFFAAASHDLRQPLHAYGLLMESLEKNVDDRNSLAIINSMKSSTRGMRELLDTVLDISKFDAGILDPKRQAVDVQQLMERLLLEYHDYTNARGIKLSVRNMNATVVGDRLFIERILRNLTSNAITHANARSILVAARFRSNRKIRFEVRDSGVGIEPEYQHVIFEEFRQGPKLNPTLDVGLGLGLAITKRLCGLMDAQLELRSAPGKGSCFAFELSVLADGSEMEFAQVHPDRNRLTGRRLWVVDNDANILAAMRFLLETWRCQVKTFANKFEVINALKSEKELPEILILDYRLPDGTALDIAGEVKTLTGTELPIVIITGDTTSDELRQIWGSRLAVLHKPVPPEQLLSALTQLVSDQT